MMAIGLTERHHRTVFIQNRYIGIGRQENSRKGAFYAF